LSISISTDIGGYCFGKFFKGKKLTKISPNKTYSGLIGSLLISVLVSFIFFRNLDLTINYLAITIILSIISQIGDLLISFLKRKAKIKDTGKFLPGHGGLLDRVDGILFAIPIGLIIISL
jgi:phosphatidate cytidylyltransferase